ncbi:PHB depolymerase family esterase [Bacteriovoracaceae bacterium]|nr:PHB depolymerase family esterase [Bacteriovoracaceae bacterium]
MKIITTMTIFILSQLVMAGSYTDIEKFGSNPGDLVMRVFIPSKAKSSMPAVVLLHGCSQNSEQFAKDSGWAKYAQKYNFALILPQQVEDNNHATCFNWFESVDTTRGSGEVESIAQMIDYTKKHYSINSKKVYVTGFSAGGAMATALLATYPENFEAGATIAGVSYGCAFSLTSAFMCMNGYKSKRPQDWGDLVRNASSFNGRFPRVSIWQSAADSVVDSDNAVEILKQWTNVHGLDTRPNSINEEDIYNRSVFEVNGREIIETFTLFTEPHAQFIFPGRKLRHCGNPAGYIVDAGICAAYHQAKFFKLLSY